MSAQLVDVSSESTIEGDLGITTKSQNMEKEEDPAERSSARILDLPEPIMMDIFSRVPVKSVLRCRCVCKSWNSIFLDPYFRKRYAVKGPTLLIVRLWFGSSIVASVMHVRDRSIQFDGRVSGADANLLRPTMGVGDAHIAMGTSNSCHGLLCLMRNKDPIGVWNPIGHNKYVPLPEITSTWVSVVGCGLGFTNKNNKYKMIRIYEPKFEEPKTTEAEVCTVGSDTWRSIGKVPYKLCAKFDAVYVNEALHWNIEDHHDFSQLICGFDIYTEKFSSLPPPPAFSSTETVGTGLRRRRRYDWSNLGVLDDCLYMCAIDYNTIIRSSEIWVMMEYGMKQSWVKRFVLKNPIMELWWGSCPPFHILKVSSNGEMLLHCGDYKLRSYNYEKQRYEGVPWSSPGVVVAPGFASIKEVECYFNS